jgi:hypothetical protein
MKIVTFVLPFGRSRLLRRGHLANRFIRTWAPGAVGLLCLLSACRVWSVDCLPPPSGLVSSWRGEGDTLDATAVNNGVPEGSLAFAPGEVGQAFVFNGIDADVKIYASPSLNVGLGGGFTIEAWIRPADLSEGRPIIEWNTGSGYPGYGVHFWTSEPPPGGNGPGCLDANLADVSGADHVFASPAGLLNTNVFQHVALTYDKASGVGMIYLNGAVVAQEQLGSLVPRTASDLYLGVRVAGIDPVGRRNVGEVDEVSLYNRALSTTEIEAIYNAGSAGKCVDPLIKTQPQSQVGYWGKSVTLTVTAVGTEPLGYQWQKDGTPLVGATGSSLLLTNLQATNAGNYSVVISNDYGSVISSNAYLTVNPAGVSLALYSGITIDGVVGLTYGIQYSTNLSNTNGWRGLANVTLGVSPQLWFDLQPVNQSQRYYRIVPGPISIP